MPNRMPQIYVKYCLLQYLRRLDAVALVTINCDIIVAMVT